MGTVTKNANPLTVTAPDTNSNELVLTLPDVFGQNASVAFIQILSGTFQFSVGGAPTSDNPVWGASDTIPPISFIPGAAGKGRNIFFIASAGGNQFRITV